MELRDKVAIIIGASAGIGLATARLFASRGARVALAARSVEKLKQLEGELPQSFAVPVDMRDPASVARMVEAVYRHYGRVDILVNNAGQGLYAPVEEVDLSEYRQTMDLNLFGPFVAMREVIPLMRSQGGGVIVNVSSLVSKMNLPELGAYASTKSALNELSLTARAELAPDNIRVCLILPRVTATDFARHALGTRVSQRLRALFGAGRPGGTSGVETAAHPSGSGTGMPPVDPPDLVAEKILEAVETESAEVYVGPIPQRWR